MGVHAHIGSQVFRIDSFARSVEVLAEFSEPYGFPELSIGGGLGVPYTEAKVGRRVKVVFEKLNDDIVLPQFMLAE